MNKDQSSGVEGGDAGEARPLSRIDTQWWLDNRANIIAALSAKGLRIMSNAEHVWLAPVITGVPGTDGSKAE